MESSGADKGFFQQPPALPNQFYDDVTFQRCFKRENRPLSPSSGERIHTKQTNIVFLPADLRDEIEPEVARLGQEVLTDRIFAWISDAERNKPYLKGSGRSAFGKWKGELVTTEGWRRLQEFGFAKGQVISTTIC